MNYKVQYLADEELSYKYNSGEMSIIYDFPDDESYKKFVDEEILFAENLEKIASNLWGEEHVSASYDCWEDKTTRLTMSRHVVTPEFIDIALKLIEEDNFERCIFCLVVENIVEKNFDYFGRFAINEDGIFVVEELKTVWENQIGK